MNEDEYWHDALKRFVYAHTYGKNYSWSSTLPDYINNEQIYKILKEPELPYYNRYDSTRDGEVAKAALEALENGITLDQLLEKNSKVRGWWSHYVKERDSARIQAEKDKERKRKAAEKKKLEDAKRAVAAAKLTPEELEAFGLTEAGKSKR